MGQFIGDAVDSLKILSDGEIRLELSIGIISTQQFYYIIYDDKNNEVGNCGIRLQNNARNEYLGNIEYTIYQQYRGNNYAEKASRLLSTIALYYNVSKITITADPSNLASNKTIQNLGARFINVRRVPEDSLLYRTSKEVNAYEWNLERGEKHDRY